MRISLYFKDLEAFPKPGESLFRYGMIQNNGRNTGT